ncbi:NAD(P)H-hydrate epimerase [Solicola gregarius]|uniref:Bifunctional NAD(P)H-hydrate repair enzyme n=1 Tax=Solicola gregarius TaxID=2908642 RepID=A0AA46TEQ1_9ACTN|nr:NAD(P)H-hydrate epimerase [Solicola gregarius]UYM03828.1 NAD(P)H-hydrate epimerase [Solicola gregarius]
MRYAHTVESVRRAEAALMATLPAGALMQRAAAGLAAVCIDVLGSVYGARVVVLVGSGDNGGDALYAAARLASRGAAVELVVLKPEAAHPDGLAAALRAGARRTDKPAWDGVDLLVDGVVGIGGRPGLRDPARTLIEDARAAGTYVVAVDVPSGVDVDGATLPEPHVTADITVTFGTHKPALLAAPAVRAAGWVQLVDIGLVPYLDEAGLESVESADVRAAYPLPSGESHKYTRGVVGVDAGSDRYAGAAELCVRGAQAGPAGMVRFGGPDSVAAEIVARRPEAVAGRGRVQAWVVGSGTADRADSALRAAAADEVPVVVDADALAYWRPGMVRGALLTPHAGELARMLDVERSVVEAAPLAYARQAAERLDATVLLKGSNTLIAERDRPTRVVSTGTPWLATAGAGDVLAGLAGSLLAAGLPARDAGSLAAWLHGAASRRAAEYGRPITAGDVAGAIPAATAAVLSAPATPAPWA